MLMCFNKYSHAIFSDFVSKVCVDFKQVVFNMNKERKMMEDKDAVLSVGLQQKYL